MHSKTAPDTGSGLLFIVSAPSGAGKTTICAAVRARIPDLHYSVSHTTRAPRKNEIHGKDYFFIEKSQFEARIRRGCWAEWAQVHGCYYGTSAKNLDDKLAQGRDILLDIDVQGARQILARYPDSVPIFILPPSLETLKDRLKSRGLDDPLEIEKRMTNAKDEIAQKGLYRHVIVNDKLPDSIGQFVGIVNQYRSLRGSR